MVFRIKKIIQVSQMTSLIKRRSKMFVKLNFPISDMTFRGKDDACSLNDYSNRKGIKNVR